MERVADMVKQAGPGQRVKSNYLPEIADRITAHLAKTLAHYVRLPLSLQQPESIDTRPTL